MDSTTSIHDWVATVSGIVQIGALFAAGIWTYLLFVRRRQRNPRAELSHDVSAHRLPNGGLLIHVELRVKNIGEVLLNVFSVRTRILQILPITTDVQDGLDAGLKPQRRTTDSEYDWATVEDWSLDLDREIHPCRIEPGESDEFHFDGILPGDIERFQVHSHVKNSDVKEKAIGWRRTSHHDVLQLKP